MNKRKAISLCLGTIIGMSALSGCNSNDINISEDVNTSVNGAQNQSSVDSSSGVNNVQGTVTVDYVEYDIATTAELSRTNSGTNDYGITNESLVEIGKLVNLIDLHLNRYKYLTDISPL